MSYDFEYYSGEMLQVPDKPLKPRLERNPTSIEARAYADALEEYESDLRSYNENLGWYRSEKAALRLKFIDKLKSDYGLCDVEFNLLWDEATSRKESDGLRCVYDEFDSLFNFVKKYTRSMKGL